MRWRSSEWLDAIWTAPAVRSERVSAAVDFPSAVFRRALREAWPEAKAVLSTRDPHR
ncbi:sulfotransferase [Actinoallomurus acaciae]|uniref:Sulfotransferase n=1 Tax=Actinoallomurus acaciae TaxID=502577 RepID=A0ABV5YLH2_9ACTN